MSLDVYLVDPEDKEENELFWSNITHNLNTMASKAGIYKHLWRPEELGIVHASELIEPLDKALKDMKERPDFYKQFNSPNGWGMYKHFIPWIEKYLEACKDYPNSKIFISR